MQNINASDYRNQKEIILAHLETYGNITTLEAFEKYKIIRCGSVINILRNEGYDIITKMEYSKKRNKRYARYFLNERNEGNEGKIL